jgi:hypothetical protein
MFTAAQPMTGRILYQWRHFLNTVTDFRIDVAIFIWICENRKERRTRILNYFSKVTAKEKKNSVSSVSKRTIPTERPPLVSEVSTNFFADRGCHVVSLTYPYSRILGFLDRSHYYFFQVAPQLYSRGWVDPVPDPLLFFCSARESNMGPPDL